MYNSKFPTSQYEIISFMNTRRIKLMISTRKFDTFVGSISFTWILKGSTQPLQNNFKMHEHKIFNRIIYHKCVEILLLYYTNLFSLYKHATAYLLPCISCINTVGTVPQSVARHYQHHSSASLQHCSYLLCWLPTLHGFPVLR